MYLKRGTSPSRTPVTAYFKLYVVAAVLLFGISVSGQTDTITTLTTSPVERELTGPESHRYKIDLKTGEFIQVTAGQKGIDITLKLTDEKGVVLAFSNRPGELQGPEILSYVAPRTGEYQLEVKGVSEYAARGSYTLARTAPRIPTVADKKRVAIEKLFSEAVTTQDIPDKEDLARSKFEQALTGWRELKDQLMVETTERQIKAIYDAKHKRAEILLNTADRLRSQGGVENLNTAVTKLNDSRNIFHDLTDPTNEALVLDTLGMTYKDLGEIKKSIAAFNEALKILPENEVEGKAAILDSIADHYVAIGEQRKAIDMYTQLLANSSIKGGIGEVMVRRGLGQAYYDLDETDTAIEYFKQALDIFDKTTEKNGRDDILLELGRAYSKLKANEKALGYYNQAVKIAKDKNGEGLILAAIGYEYFTQNNFDAALKYYSDALEVLTNNKSGQTIVNNNYGVLYAGLDDRAQALKYYEAALALTRETKDKNTEALTHNNLGLLYNKFGENEDALKQYELALDISRKNDNRSLESLTLINIGFLYVSLGDSQAALDNYNKALVLVRDLGNKKAEAFANNNIGLVFAQLRQKDKALEAFENARRLDKTLESTILNNIGAVYMSSGEFQKARDSFERALPLIRSKGDGSLESTTLNNIGWAYQSLGDKPKAIEYFTRALPLYKAIDDRRGEAIALNNLMYAWDMLGNRRFAIFYGKHAVKNLQSLRADIKGIDKDLQQGFLGSVEGAYRKLSDMLMSEGRLDEAQQVLSAFKDQEYFDPNTSGRRQSQPLSLTPRETSIDAIYQQKSSLRAEAAKRSDALKREIADHSPSADETAKLTRLEQESSAADKEFAAFLTESGATFAKATDAQDRPPSIPETAELQTVLRDLQAKTGQTAAAIYTLQGEDNFRCLIVTPDKLSAVSYSIKAVDLKKKIADFSDRLSQPDPQNGGPKYPETDVKRSAKELYDVIFTPIETKLKQIGVDPAILTWSLDGELGNLPIGALFDGNKYLAERYRNVVFTRANSERLTAPVSPVWTGTGLYTSKEYSVPVGGPDGKAKLVGFAALKNAESEVETIFGSSGKPGILTGEQEGNIKFTKASFFNALKQNRPLVHIASHFRFEAGDENLSFLLLGDGTKLTLKEIKDAPDDLLKGVELLTLSACETAVQKARPSDGREIDGFAELAQRKGAKAVLASLWKVDDQSTSRLMAQFYGSRQSNKLTKAESLQKAQLSLLADKQFSHPYYWAPFILIGNWR